MEMIQDENFRLRWITLNSAKVTIDEKTEVVRALTQTPKTLPCRYFYDDRGSVLFEQICELPEYYPTRTEQAILSAYAPEIARMTGACELVELGSGSSRKTRLLLEAYQQFDRPLYYFPIDVSAGILKTTALDLLHQYPTLEVCGLAGTYEQALAQLPLTAQENRLLIFLGSTLGNLDETECDRFLAQIQQALQPGEFFLLGVDLQKSIAVIESAYNDAQGVTAAFNLNVLRHLNQRFQGNFAPDRFAHRAFYNPQQHQIEMHLLSLTTQIAVLPALNCHISIEAGETIRTEISRKFHLPTLVAGLEHQALQPLQIWTDPQGWFALLLCQRQAIAAY